MNPHQQAEVLGPLPLRVLSGAPSYINLLDALAGSALVRELSATGLVAAASFKHVAPAGAAVAGALDLTMRRCWALPAEADEVTRAYARARDADPKSSFGDLVAVSAPVTRELAAFLATVVSDGIVAPDFEDGTVAALARKKQGAFLVLQLDPRHQPAPVESRTVHRVTLRQEADVRPLDPAGWRVVAGPAMSAAQTRDALLGMATLRHTPSNAGVFARDGMCLGVGAGQQSRVDSTRLAGNKAAVWWLRRHPRFEPPASGAHSKAHLARQLEQIDHLLSPRWLTEERSGPEEVAEWLGSMAGLTAASDGYLPFADNVELMARYGAGCVVEPGGSLRSEEVAAACRARGITLVHTGHRLFHH